MQELISQAQEIRTDGTAYDFAPIAKAIGDKRVMMLGEPDHGDGMAFLLKAKLVEYLHEHCGFDVLAMESDFYSFNKDYWLQDSELSQTETIKQSLYEFWRVDSNMKKLWEYVEKSQSTENPLSVTGFDVRHTTRISRQLPDDLEKYLLKKIPKAIATEEYAKFKKVFVEVIEQEYEHSAKEATRQEFLGFLFSIKNKTEKYSSSEDKFWQQMFYDLVCSARNSWGGEYRDVGMAKNTIWLANEQFAGKKIMVWAHNYHIGKDMQEMQNGGFEFAMETWRRYDKVMGNVLADELGEDIFALGLIPGGRNVCKNGYQGDYETLSPVEVGERSLEHELNLTGIKNAYLNLRKTIKPFTMNGLIAGDERELCWGKMFDGILYYREAKGLSIT